MSWNYAYTTVDIVSRISDWLGRKSNALPFAPAKERQPVPATLINPLNGRSRVD